MENNIKKGVYNNKIKSWGKLNGWDEIVITTTNKHTTDFIWYDNQMEPTVKNKE